jgi:hypothetical protein
LPSGLQAYEPFADTSSARISWVPDFKEHITRHERPYLLEIKLMRSPSAAHRGLAASCASAVILIGSLPAAGRETLQIINSDHIKNVLTAIVHADIFFNAMISFAIF